MALSAITPTCVFYIPPTSTTQSNGSWSTSGCTTYTLNWSHARCVCNHLTSFAVLVSNESRNDADKHALSLITYIGIAISLLGIGITLATVGAIDQLRRQLRYQVTPLGFSNIVVKVHAIRFTILSFSGFIESCHCYGVGTCLFYSHYNGYQQKRMLYCVFWESLLFRRNGMPICCRDYFQTMLTFPACAFRYFGTWLMPLIFTALLLWCSTMAIIAKLS